MNSQLEDFIIKLLFALIFGLLLGLIAKFTLSSLGII